MIQQHKGSTLPHTVFATQKATAILDKPNVPRVFWQYLMQRKLFAG